MMKLLTFSYLSVLLVSAIKGEGMYDAPHYIDLYHNLEGESSMPKWENCSSISLENMNGMLQPQINLGIKDSAKLLKLATQNGKYILKAVVRTSKGKETELFTYTRACAVFENDPQLFFTVNFDHGGSIIGVNLSPKYICTKNLSSKKPHEMKIDLLFSYKLTEQGPVPDTATYIQKIEKEREAKEKGGVQDHRSFLAKYWMYIVPFFLFVVLSGAANSEGQQGS